MQRSFSKNKLALLGKNISHSRSREVYETIFGEKITYSHLDFATAGEIPPLDEIFSKYDGLSITTPWKEHFIGQVVLSGKIPPLDAINCIKKEGDRYIATNTDYLAVQEMISNLEKNYGTLSIVLLGNGPMSRITSIILEKKGMDFMHMTRASHGDLTSVSLTGQFSENGTKKLIINACSRSFLFRGDVPSDALFWDYNYNMPELESLINGKCTYESGYLLLLRQGEKAVEFWSEFETE